MAFRRAFLLQITLLYLGSTDHVDSIIWPKTFESFFSQHEHTASDLSLHQTRLTNLGHLRRHTGT